MATPGAVYAKAVFEVSQKNGGAEPTIQKLRAVWSLCLENKGLMMALCGAGVSASARKGIVKDLSQPMDLGALTERLLLVLAERSRIGALPEIISELEALQDRATGISTGELRSTVELSSDDVSVLTVALAKHVGTKVRLQQTVDPSLLGGFVATVGGKTYDASLKTQLERFKNELI